MNPTSKAALTAGLSLVTLSGIFVAIARAGSSATPAAPAPGTTPIPGVPPAGSVVWIRASTLTQGQTVRISVPEASLAQFSPFTQGTGIAAFEAILSTPTIVNLLGIMTISTWGPGGTPVPSDWPPDDTAAASEFHAQFVYGETAAAGTSLPPLAVSQLATTIPGLIAWVPKGTGA